MSSNQAETLEVREETQDAQLKAPGKQKRRRKRRRILIIAAVILVAAAAGFFLAGRLGGKKVKAGPEYMEYTVTRRNISRSISGTGTLEPADSYTVTTLIEGEILEAGFEEGDIVEKGDVLYVVDSSDVSTGIEQAQISLEQSRRNYEQKLKALEELNVKAPESGQVVELKVKAGDQVSAGQAIAVIRDSATMTLTVPFGTDDAVLLSAGQPAQVTLDGSFETLEGRVTAVSAVEKRLEGNRLVREVTIDVPNPGGIYEGQTATAMAGGAACAQSGTFRYRAEKTVQAGVSGEVAALHIGEGDWVTAGQLLMRMENEQLELEVKSSADALRNSELQLQNRYDQLENYTIKSPISGTIIEKNYKKGDTLESGRNLCTIFDLSYLTMTLYVDELDISEIEEGQPVIVTADAVANRFFAGVVTKINIRGVTSNGATSYPVTIRIDETEGLLPGMNAQARIITQQRQNVLAVPVSALRRGNLVLAKTGGAVSEIPLPEGVPEGFTYVPVTPGVSDDEFIEIVDGLKEGDVIAVSMTDNLFAFNFQFGFMMPGMGGPPAGGMARPGGFGGAPAGGFGGAPSGGMSRPGAAAGGGGPRG